MDGALDLTETLWDKSCRLLPFNEAVTVDEVFDRILTQTAHLWTGNKSAVVTEVTDEGFLHIWLAGGDMAELLKMLPSGESFAKAMNCRGIELDGRKGWKRIMERFGFIPVDGNLLRKYFGHGQ